MARLNAAKRKALPASDFALPGRRYPIEDRSHGQNAKARVSQHGTSAEKATVRAKVKAKFGFKAGGSVEGEASADRMDKRRRGGKAC
jgi:hypothetical protein